MRLEKTLRYRESSGLGSCFTGWPGHFCLSVGLETVTSTLYARSVTASSNIIVTYHIRERLARQNTTEFHKVYYYDDIFRPKWAILKSQNHSEDYM